MKKILTALVILCFLGCKKNLEGYAVTGNIDSIEDGRMVRISELDEINQPKIIDSVAIQDNKFSIDLPDVDTPKLSFLTINGLNGNIVYISENEPIHFEINKDSLNSSKVSGGKENRLFNTYLNHLKSLNKKVARIRNDYRNEMMTNRDSANLANLEAEERALRESDLGFKKKIIKENPDAYVSVLALTDMQSMGAPATEIKESYDLLSAEMKDTPLASTLNQNLQKLLSVEIGSKAPTFSGPNPQGEEVSLENSLGKVTLIDFWAAWCKPCRDENPNIVNVYEKYHDAGFNIVGVSLDRPGQKEQWMQAIQDDNLTWPQISHLQFWQEPIAQLYGVQAIPAQFLLDENGVIVAKSLRGDDLEAKVKELLEK